MQTFLNIPANIRAPLFYAEFRSGGTPYQSIARALIIGQMFTSGGNAGEATAGQAYLMSDGAEDTLFGPGSMLAQMYKMARDQAPTQEIWCAGLADAGAGVVATGKITVSAVAPHSGTLVWYIAGIRCRIAVATTDTVAQVATKIAAEINKYSSIPVSAAVNGSNDDEVDLTAKWKGTTGNTILVDIGLVQEEGTLGKSMLTVTAMASGAGDPDAADVLDNLADEEFDWIVCPYADTDNLNALRDFLSDVAGRWSPTSQLYGHAITAKADTLGGLSSLGNGRNDQHVSIVACNKFRSPPYMVAAAIGAWTARDLQSPPLLSAPLQTVVLRGIKGPLAISDRLNRTDRNTLLYDGISSLEFRRDGQVMISRLISTYQVNDWGDPDATYLDVNTLAQSMYGIRYIRQTVTNQHGRKALARANPGNVDIIATPDDIRNTIVHAYQDLTALGVFEDAGLFAQDLLVEIDAIDPNRVNVMMPLDHVNQLRIIAVAAVNYLQRSAPRAALAA